MVTGAGVFDGRISIFGVSGPQFLLRESAQIPATGEGSRGAVGAMGRKSRTDGCVKYGGGLVL